MKYLLFISLMFFSISLYAQSEPKDSTLIKLKWYSKQYADISHIYDSLWSKLWSDNNDISLHVVCIIMDHIENDFLKYLIDQNEFDLHYNDKAIIKKYKQQLLNYKVCGQ